MGLTYLHIVFGEMIPKALALRHPEATALWLHTPTRWFKLALWPLVFGLNATGERLLRVLGVAAPAAGRAQTPETLRYLVDESVVRGELDSEAGEVVDELFEFGNLAAAQVMTPRVQVIGIRHNAGVADVRRIVRSAKHMRYPVYDDTLDQILGMVLVRDLVQVLVQERPLSADLVRPVPFVAATTRLDVALARMHHAKTRMLVVMDEHGGTAGILTDEDLFKHIVGRGPEQGVQAQPVYEVDAELRALGVALLDQVGEQLGVELAHPEVDTVSGLVLTLLDRPPVVGDRVTFRGVEFAVCATQGRGVRECRLSVVHPPEGAPPAPAGAG
jgi:CBS domain containing-hemolysin-like protein